MTVSDDALFQAFDPSQPIANLAGNLPHFRQPGTTYFLTFRAADSIPQKKLAQWKTERAEWLRTHPEPHTEAERRDYFNRFPARLEHWLDQSYGACVLRRPELKQLVEEALGRFDGERYRLDEYVVMPNHVHVLVTPLGGYELSAILHPWKSFTGTEINKRLRARGAFWQKETFDHIVRNADALEKYAEYIRRNPMQFG